MAVSTWLCVQRKDNSFRPTHHHTRLQNRKEIDKFLVYLSTIVTDTVWCEQLNLQRGNTYISTKYKNGKKVK